MVFTYQFCYRDKIYDIITAFYVAMGTAIEHPVPGYQELQMTA